MESHGSWTCGTKLVFRRVEVRPGQSQVYYQTCKIIMGQGKALRVVDLSSEIL